MQLPFLKAHAIKKNLSNVHLHSKKNMQRHCLLTKFCIKTPTWLSANMFPLYHLGTPTTFSAIFIVSYFRRKHRASDVLSTTVSCWLSNSFPRLYFKVLSLTCWCKVQREFSKTWGSKWMTEEKYLRCTLCHKLRKKNLHRKKQQKPQILSMHPFKKCFFFFLNFWKQLNVNQKQFLSNCSKQCLFKIYIYFFAT